MSCISPALIWLCSSEGTASSTAVQISFLLHCAGCCHLQWQLPSLLGWSIRVNRDVLLTEQLSFVPIKHLLEVSLFFCLDPINGGVVATRPWIRWVYTHSFLRGVNVSISWACQYRLSLVVKVCVVVESSCREPLRPSRDRQCRRFWSSLDTLLEKAVYIQGLVHEFRLASSIRMVKATPVENTKI